MGEKQSTESGKDGLGGEGNHKIVWVEGKESLRYRVNGS